MRRHASFPAMALLMGLLLDGCKSPFSSDKGGGTAARLAGPSEDGPDAGVDPGPAGKGSRAGSRGKGMPGP